MGDILYKAGLYLRLSKDDERAGESVSIENQKMLLTNYAEEEGWDIVDVYIDDGWSGTNFQRPSFQRMIADARDKRINVIVVKDLSRLGRNHIEVGRLTDDVFPELGVRFVAVNDRVDSLLGDDDMAAYRNLFNEFLSKDTSRKVRAVKKACMERGKYLGTYAPYGYKKNPLDKHHLVIDEETAHIVRRMFELRCQGMSYHFIASTLSSEHIPSPKDLYYRRKEKKNPTKMSGLWNAGTVKGILCSEIYIGHMVQGKFGTVSYKNHKQVPKPEEQWIRVENTHEPLIEMEKWETVQELEAKNYKPRECADGKRSMFVGLLRCADCGFNMRALSRQGKKPDGVLYDYMHFICGSYARNGKAACTTHTIREEALVEVLLDEIRERAQQVIYDEQRVVDMIMQTKSRESIAYLATYQRELKSAVERLSELDNVIRTLYEDRVSGVITESMFKSLMPKYEREREDKTAAVQILKSKVEKSERDWCNVDMWMKIVRKYAELKTLTPDILLKIIDHIDVFESEKVDKQWVCHVRIVYRFVGDIGNSMSLLAKEANAYEDAV